MSTYRTYSRRSGNASKARWMDLRYAGTCATCGEAIPAGQRAFYDPADRTVCHMTVTCGEPYGVTEQKWVGSPVSGRYVTTLAERRLGGTNTADPFRRTRSRGYFGHDAGRCEDAPCCGCCS